MTPHHPTHTTPSRHAGTAISRRHFIAVSGVAGGVGVVGAGMLLPGCVIDRGRNGVAPHEVEGGLGAWRNLFNGRDLNGWVNVNGWTDTWAWRDDTLVTTGKPICVLRTERMYENFEFEMEWRHRVPGGNAGLFLWSDALPARGQPFTRAIEVQVLDGRTNENYTSHGDVFAIHGAVMTPDRPHPGGWMRCLPSEHRALPSPNWNHYRVIANDGRVKLSVNGKEVSGGFDISPRKGYICIESEGSEAHFRNLRLRELPSTGATADQTAQADSGFVSLYTSADLRGWQVTADHAPHWKSNDWRIETDGQGPPLWSDPATSALQQGATDFDLMVDWRVTRVAPGGGAAAVLLNDNPTNGLTLSTEPNERWSRTHISVRGRQARYSIDDQTRPTVNLDGPTASASIGLSARGATVEWANVYARVSR